MANWPQDDGFNCFNPPPNTAGPKLDHAHLDWTNPKATDDDGVAFFAGGTIVVSNFPNGVPIGAVLVYDCGGETADNPAPASGPPVLALVNLPAGAATLTVQTTQDALLRDVCVVGIADVTAWRQWLGAWKVAQGDLDGPPGNQSDQTGAHRG
jgi:hypothetical protein